MKRIGLVTSQAWPALTEDDQLLAVELTRRGYRVGMPIWDDENVAWNDYDGLMIRSTWDYFERRDVFLAWVAQIDALGVPLWNPAEVLRWNSHKQYLRQFERAGIPVPQSEWVDPGTAPDLREILCRRGWHKAVVKPQVSGGARGTFVVDLNDPSSVEPRDPLFESGLIVQQFLPEIPDFGEWSLLFYGGVYSHAVVKTPKSGDFRVQAKHGGSYRSMEPKPEIVEQAQRVLAQVAEPLLYARVDGVVRDDTLLLIELEILEPALFFGYREGSERLLADALLARLD